MTQDRRHTIGFDRKVEIEWLDAIAGRLADGASANDAREYVSNLLEGVLSTNGSRGARGKTMTVLTRIWSNVLTDVQPLREDALRVVSKGSRDDRLAAHWAMISAAYPFFIDVAANAGKLISLNGDFTLSQMTRRMIDAWGDRSTLSMAIQRVLRSMVQWGVLDRGEASGQYLPAGMRRLVSVEAAALLLEAVLIAEGCGMPMSKLLSHPALFPFETQFDASSLRNSPRLRLHRQGDQTDFVEREFVKEPGSAQLRFL